MSILLTISDFIIPVTILFIVVFGCLQRVNIYEVFLEGAKEGLKTVIEDGWLSRENLQKAGKDDKWLDRILEEKGARIHSTLLLTVDAGGL